MQYIIRGGKKLNGEIRIAGNKNAFFPCIAASLLTEEEVILENIAEIRDIDVLIQILKDLGVTVSKNGSTLTIKAHDMKKSTLKRELVVKLRGSVVLAGAILGRLGRVSFYHPGGDIIGKRSIQTHLDGFKQLGAITKVADLQYWVQFPESPSRTSNIFLEEASVTAVENLILASVLGERTVILRNCPTEPHVVDLCKMLIQMGARIEGVGTPMLKIDGVSKLHGTRYRIGSDYLELGTYAVAAAITGGTIKMSNIDDFDYDPIFLSLQKFGVVIEKKGEYLIASAGKLKSVPKVITNIWPGFPTDLMSVVIVLASQSKGVTLCHDWMYESRMFFVDKLISMGANITLADPHRVLVYGPSKLKGRELATPDIRAGMALVLASLVAKGKSVINKAELIERGYEGVVGKLRILGADIEKRNE